MAKQKEIKLINLLVNTENYRFEPLASQKEAIDNMIENQIDKLINLAKHIVDYGLNPNDRIQVIASQSVKSKYIVLEGNRRVVSLKLLNDPSLIDNPRYKTLKSKFTKLHNSSKSKLIKEVSCTIYDNIDEANIWIKVKHGGQLDGIGTVDWNALQIQRYEEKVEGKSSIVLQALKIVKEAKETPKVIKDKIGSIKITNLDRLLGDPDVRSKLGVEIKNGVLYSEVDQKEVIKGFNKVIKDLLNPKFKVQKIYTKDDRKKYIGSIKKSDLPDTTNKASKPWQFSASSKTKTRKTKTKNPLPKERKTLIPKSCTLSISYPKVNTMYDELQKIDITKFTNCVSVSFRVFVELSIDCYLEKNDLVAKPTAAKSGIDFQQKVFKVANHLESLKIADSAIAKGMKVAIKKKNDLLGLDTWHAYVHNNRFSPSAKDMITTWDGIQDFMLLLWDNAN